MFAYVIAPQVQAKFLNLGLSFSLCGVVLVPLCPFRVGNGGGAWFGVVCGHDGGLWVSKASSKMISLGKNWLAVE